MARIKNVQRKICSECKAMKPITDFYDSFDEKGEKNGVTKVCKDCFKTKPFNRDGTMNLNIFKDLLRISDKPYIPKELENATIKANKEVMETGDIEKRDVISKYMHLISLKQYRSLHYADSVEKYDDPEPKVTRNIRKPKSLKNEANEIYMRQDDDDFVVTPEMIDLFGEGYSLSDYRAMKRKYDKLKINYNIQTNLHEEALATYVRFKVKEEQATARGDVTEASKWNTAAQEAADKAKLTPKQLTQADLQSGVNSFSEIFRAVEEAIDVIPILPQFKFQPRDALDFTIWCYINYARNLQGLPECDYKDVYAFYDRKKNEYLEQYSDPYGIFENDTTEENRPRIEKFINLPNEYESDSVSDAEESSEIV